MKGLAPGDKVLLLTWLDRAERNVLSVHPRDDLTRPLTGVFATRSSGRPNPVGVHHIGIVEIRGLVVAVDHLEAVDGTPIVDVKPEIVGPS